MNTPPADILQTLSLTLGVGWASGINLYAATLMLGYLGMTGAIHLPPGLEILTNPLVVGASGLMYCVEFFADKIPGVDNSWDALHTFVRIPAGALLAAGAATGLGMGSPGEFVAFLLGGGLATGSHAAKAGSRVLINGSLAIVTGWAVSIGEDLTVLGGLWMALQNPWFFLAALTLFVLLLVWLLPRLWRGIKTVFGWLFGRRSPGASAQ
ncbi:MAG: DUF4126 domain-containing protein [Pseudomonadota bacterium]